MKRNASDYVDGILENLTHVEVHRSWRSFLKVDNYNNQTPTSSNAGSGTEGREDRKLHVKRQNQSINKTAFSLELVLRCDLFLEIKN